MNAVAATRRWSRFLDSTTPVYAASAISLALGLSFIFVWSPLPWGWLGIDHYDDRALRLAAGEPFDTTDVPWGYAYYLAAFYRLFGHRLWPPLVFQALLNATTPMLLYRLVRPLADHRTAALSALLTGVFSFNTVYAGTQSSDAICTVLVLGSLLLFEHGRRMASVDGLRRSADGATVVAFAASGLLIGVAVQFRPNLILFPLALAGALVLVRPVSATLRLCTVYLAVFAVMQGPWIIRNYRLTGEFLPTSTHGGIQLWMGTLQAGAYLENRTDNPRKYFEPATFDYTSVEHLPILVRGVTGARCDVAPDLVYWTSRDPRRVHVKPSRYDGRVIEFWIPGQPSPTTVNGHFAGGPTEPFVFFVSTEHLRDLDADQQLLDVFDVVRLVSEGAANDADIRAAVDRLVATVVPGAETGTLAEIVRRPESAMLKFVDGSTIVIPRHFGGLITDLEVNGELAGSMLYARTSMNAGRALGADAAGSCDGIIVESINDVFYRREPHLMRRYTALALDNIRRDPLAFAAASAYRSLRVFIIRGSADVDRTQQFAGSGPIYAAGSLLSFGYFGFFAAGAWIAVRRRIPVRRLLVPVLYVPLTICFMLTNMRYSITVQPYVLTFVAVAMLAALERHGR